MAWIIIVFLPTHNAKRKHDERTITFSYTVRMGSSDYQDPEIGRDKDTGGQVKYVLEFLENLSHHPQVSKVDLFTRRISDKRVSSAYEKEIEISE